MNRRHRPKSPVDRIDPRRDLVAVGLDEAISNLEAERLAARAAVAENEQREIYKARVQQETEARARLAAEARREALLREFTQRVAGVASPVSFRVATNADLAAALAAAWGDNGPGLDRRLKRARRLAFARSVFSPRRGWLVVDARYTATVQNASSWFPEREVGRRTRAWVTTQCEFVERGTDGASVFATFAAMERLLAAYLINGGPLRELP